MVREVVADTLERMADADERLRMVTVTSVDVAPDLRHAVVYLSSLSETTAEALSAHRVRLQQEIGRQVHLKRTPQLAFAADPAVEHGNRVEELLRRIHRRQTADPAGEGAPGPGPGEGTTGSGPGDGARDDDGG